MDQSSSVDYRVLAAKVLHDSLPAGSLQISSCRVDHTIDDVFVLGDDEAKDSLHTEEEVVNRVTLLVHVGVLCGESRPQLRGYPGSEVCVADPLEPLHLAEVVSMDLLRDLEA